MILEDTKKKKTERSESREGGRQRGRKDKTSFTLVINKTSRNNLDQEICRNYMKKGQNLSETCI